MRCIFTVHLNCSVYTLFALPKVPYASALRACGTLLGFAFETQLVCHTRGKKRMTVWGYEYYARMYGPIKHQKIALRCTVLYALRLYETGLTQPYRSHITVEANTYRTGTVPYVVLQK
jgi:hypothetical protein